MARGVARVMRGRDGHESLESYDVQRLVASRKLDTAIARDPKRHILCDIDKTYLETEFDSLLGMARTALESAEDKVTVDGATWVLRALRWGGGTLEDLDERQRKGLPAPLHFVSSSPPQLRSVLEEKLARDGLDWTSDTFKNQLYNLRKGHLSLLRRHVAYKSAAIFRIAASLPEDSDPNWVMIGDSAETDPWIYLAWSLWNEGVLEDADYDAVLPSAGVHPDLARDVRTPGERVQRQGRTSLILIRQLPGEPRARVPEPFRSRVFPFHTYTEALAALLLAGVLEASSLEPTLIHLHNRARVEVEEIGTVLSTLIQLTSETAAEPGRYHALREHARASLATFRLPVPTTSAEPILEDSRRLGERLRQVLLRPTLSRPVAIEALSAWGQVLAGEG